MVMGVRKWRRERLARVEEATFNGKNHPATVTRVAPTAATRRGVVRMETPDHPGRATNARRREKRAENEPSEPAPEVVAGWVAIRTLDAPRHQLAVGRLSRPRLPSTVERLPIDVAYVVGSGERVPRPLGATEGSAAPTSPTSPPRGQILATERDTDAELGWTGKTVF